MGPDLELVEAIATRVAELVGAERSESARYIKADELADLLNVERDWVYAHAKELGGIRLGGPRGRLRFDRVFIEERFRPAPDEGRAGSRGSRKPLGRGSKSVSKQVKSPEMHTAEQARQRPPGRY
jgi:hypothetical protein